MQGVSDCSRAVIRRRRYFVITGCLAVLLGILGIAAMVPPQSTNIHPERVKTSGKLELNGTLWYSDHKLIGWFGRPDIPYQLEQLDLVSGKVVAIPHGNADVFRTWAAPDGQRLLVLDGLQWVLKGLDDHVYEKRNTPQLGFPMEIAWMSDSSAWAYMEGRDHGSTLHLYRVGSTKSDSDSKYAFPDYPKVIGFPDPNHVLVYGDRNTIDLYLLKDKAVLQKSLPFSLMDSTTNRSLVREVALSPDGKHLCWLVLSPFEPEPTILSKLEAWFPKAGNLIPRKPNKHADATIATFWTTALDGTHKQRITSITLDKVSSTLLDMTDWSPDPLGGITPGEMTWSHEGKHITYRLNRELWAITLPREESEQHR